MLATLKFNFRKIKNINFTRNFLFLAECELSPLRVGEFNRLIMKNANRKKRESQKATFSFIFYSNLFKLL